MTEEKSQSCKTEEKSQKQRQIGIFKLLKHSSPLDFVYICVGILAAIVAGCGWPVLWLFFGIIINVFTKFERDYQQIHVGSSNQTDQIVADLMNTTYVFSGALFGVTVLFILCNYITIHCFQVLALRQMGIIKRKYFKSILKQDIAWFDQQNSGEFASRISSDFKKIESGINENLGLLIFNISTSIASLITGLVYGWKLSLVMISTSPIIVIAAFITAKVLRFLFYLKLRTFLLYSFNLVTCNKSSYSAATSVAEEAISAIRTVFAFCGQAKESERYEHKLRPAMLIGCKRNLVTALGNSMNWFTVYGTFAIATWYGTRLILTPSDAYQIGDLVVVFWTITSAGFYIGYAAPFLESFQIARSAALGIYQIIDRSSEIDSSSEDGKKLESNYQIDIELKNVHFSYPTRSEVSILSGLDLKINNGEIVALVGPSGCGKSTIVQLIQRFYDPEIGEVTLNGVNLKELNIAWLRAQIGVVGQEPVLFDASIEENIRLGGSQITENIKSEDIVQAAQEANVHDFIHDLQEGYQTYVGDRGAQLSGGQKQRIAIARALISKPKILLLDEATSALDLQSETVVQAALDRASKGRTTIIVAHRLSTIINADRIIFLDKGKVIEMGTHKELMDKKSAYYQMVLAQQIKEPEDELEDTDSKITSTQPHRQTRSITSSITSFDGSLIALPNKEDQKLTIPEELSGFPYARVLTLIWSESALYFTIALLSALAYGLVTPVYALIFGLFMEEFTIHAMENPDYLESETVKYSIFYACLALCVFVANAVQITLFGLVGERLTLRLRTMAFSAILTQEVAWFDEPVNSAGALCSRLATDAANIQGATGLRIAVVIQSLSTLVCSILVGFIYNWRMALVGLALMPLVIASVMISAKLYSGQAKQDGKTAQISSKILIEVMNVIRTVVSLHKQTYFYDKFVRALDDHFSVIRKSIFAKVLVLSISLGIPFFAYAITFLLGGFLVSRRLLTSSDYLKIVESMVYGAIVIGQTAILSSDFAKAKLAAISIFKLIDQKVGKINFAELQIPIDRSKGNVSFRGVCFSYPSRPEQSILNCLSFSANKGETVALVGSSGCGKSTTIQLLEQFYDCLKGSIYLDGQNIKKINTDWVRSQMALVSQEPILFSYSIADNIAYGDNTRAVELNEIIRAAQMANVHDFIRQLPQGYDTPVGSKGTKLSGGQKQRIAIARALIRDPAILLLDEATSALDTASEKVVQDALNEASKGRTCLVIAHRLKTIVNADKIVVIHRGQNVEEGTHEELLACKGFYWKLYSSVVTN